MKKILALALLLCMALALAVPAQAATALTMEELVKILNEPGGNKSAGLPTYLEGKVGAKRAEATVKDLKNKAGIIGGNSSGSSILGNNTVSITGLSSTANALSIMGSTATTYMYKCTVSYTYNTATTCYINYTITSGNTGTETITNNATQVGPKNLTGTGSSSFSFDFYTSRTSTTAGMKVLSFYLYDSNNTLLNTASYAFY